MLILVVTEVTFLEVVITFLEVVFLLVFSLSLPPLSREIEKTPEEEPFEAILRAATLKAEINELLDKLYEEATLLTEL